MVGNISEPPLAALYLNHYLLRSPQSRQKGLCLQMMRYRKGTRREEFSRLSCPQGRPRSNTGASVQIWVATQVLSMTGMHHGLFARGGNSTLKTKHTHGGDPAEPNKREHFDESRPHPRLSSDLDSLHAKWDIHSRWAKHQKKQNRPCFFSSFPLRASTTCGV